MILYVNNAQNRSTQLALRKSPTTLTRKQLGIFLNVISF